MLASSQESEVKVGFNLSSEQLQERERDMELDHFSHEHPLILLDEEQQKDDDDGDQKVGFCDGCSEPIYGVPSYSCSHVECVFNLHKCCAQLPPEIQQHPLHSKHTLTLFPKSPYRFGGFMCNNCRLISNHFSYHCSLCSFDLDIRCAIPMLEINIEHKSHTHPLVPLKKEASLFCEACGRKHQGKFYACPTCIQSIGVRFFIHMDCLLLPTTLKHSSHADHILKLSYSFPPDYSQFYRACNICSKRLLPNFWVYYCGGCRYFIHVHCATTSSKTENIETSQKEPFMSILDS